MSDTATATIIPIESLRQPGKGTRFEGIHHDVATSFFVVNSPTGGGAAKHRHPYPEVFVLLDGEIEVKVNDAPQRVGAGNIVVVPTDCWHEFEVVSSHPARMVNIHPAVAMIQENWSDDDR